MTGFSLGFFGFSTLLPLLSSCSPLTMISARLSCLATVLLASLYLIPDPLLCLLETLEPRIIWRSHRSVNNKRPRVALSIDDVPYLGSKHGPRTSGHSHMAEILDILAQHDARATIMVMSHEDGREHYPDILARAVREGHELGNHGTIDEKSAWLPQVTFEANFEHCHRLITRLQPNSGQKWFRPGSGVWTSEMLSYIESRGYKAVLASVYPLLELPLPLLGLEPLGTWLTTWFLKMRVRPGAVLLLHDRWHTPAALRAALPSIVAQYDVLTISELFDVNDEK